MEPLKLLWTGGWDSTFRLCELLIVHKRVVQPYYLIDENRKSLRHELQAQKEIKSALIKKFPFVKELILPTQISAISDISLSREIGMAYKELSLKASFGTQYEWLANFCESNQIDDLELSFEKDPGAKKNLFLKPYIIDVFSSDMKTFKIDPDKEGAVKTLLKYYLWPLWDTSREDMVKISKKHNFFDIMHLSWFCHNPVHNKACGRCNPCIDAVYYGFGYRLNRRAKLRYATRKICLRSIKSTIHKTTKLNEKSSQLTH